MYQKIAKSYDLHFCPPFLQNLLIKAGCKLSKYGADGHCGDETVAALKAFQTANSLTPDGICGALTWAKLDKV